MPPISPLSSCLDQVWHFIYNNFDKKRKSTDQRKTFISAYYQILNMRNKMDAISRAGTAYNSWALELSHSSLDSASFFDIVELSLVLNIAEMMIAGQWAIQSICMTTFNTTPFWKMLVILSQETTDLVEPKPLSFVNGHY